MESLQETIRREGPKRADGVAIPYRWPDGWVHLAAATAALAHALVDGGLGDSSGALAFALNIEHEGTPADLLGERVAEFIAELCADGNLRTGYGPVGVKSAPIAMPTEWWETDDPFIRFRSWSIDPDDLLRDGVSLPDWIWVEQDSLETQLSRIEHIGDPAHALPNVRFDSDGVRFVAFPLARALDVIAVALPESQEAGAVAMLVRMCADSEVKSAAGRMERYVDADDDHQGGKPVEAVPQWPIRPKLWKSPKAKAHDWKEGRFSARDGRDTYHLSNVMIDRTSLFRQLAARGLVRKSADPIGWAEVLDDMAWVGFEPVHVAKHSQSTVPRISDTAETIVTKEPEPPRSSGQVSRATVEKWFREVRCPEFDGHPAPNWGQCWKAAKEHFAPVRVTKSVLQAARRAAAPADWQKSGPRS